jgi:hypothetical protein
MSDILQDPEGDILIENNSPAIVEGIEEIRQRITQRLRTFYGEWFLDTSAGVRYLQEVLKKNPNAVLRDAILKSEITGTPGVESLESYSFIVDGASRTGRVSFRARTISGNIQAEVAVP